MKNTNRSNLLPEELSQDEAGLVGGGTGKLEKYNIQEYSVAGIVWEHMLYDEDRYYIYGIKIDRKTAELITDRTRSLGRRLNEDELRKLGVAI